MNRIKVIVATSDAIFQEGLCRFLEEEDDMECVARPTSANGTLKSVKKFKPDVVIIDFDIKFTDSCVPPQQKMHVIEVIKQLKAENPPANAP